MRVRIEKERTPAGKDALAFKTGVGGTIDVEFAAQIFCLAQGWQEPNTLRALQAMAVSNAFARSEAACLIAGYLQLRRIESILRRDNFRGVALLPESRAALQHLAVRCGYPDAEHFMASVNRHRRVIREIYESATQQELSRAASAQAA